MLLGALTPPRCQQTVPRSVLTVFPASVARGGNTTEFVASIGITLLDPRCSDSVSVDEHALLKRSAPPLCNR